MTTAVSSVSPTWLPELRRRALDRHSALGFPTTHDEDWHYTSVAPIAEATFGEARESAALPTAAKIAPYVIDESWSRLVFVNGHFAKDLSSFAELPDDVEVSTLRAALAENPAFLQAHLSKLQADNTFAALNTAHMTDGVVVSIPKDCVVEHPLHVLWVSDAGASNNAVYPRLLVEAGSHSKVAIVETYVALGATAYLTNAVSEIRVGDGAHVEHYRLQREGTDAFHVANVQATQGRDSIFHSFSFAAGARLSRANIYTTMGMPGAEARLNGLYLLGGNQHCDHQTFVHHAAEKCASRELYKGILDDASHGVFNGKVLVDPIAQQTDGKQTNHTLLLSDRAKMDTKPQLEIFADDVKCTHGATVGRLDENTMFYLKSRGINHDTARALLMYAFAADALETIEVPALKRSLQALAFERYNHAPLV